MRTAQTEAMRRAIDLGKSQHPHPNPRVGAVILDETGRILAEGAHAGPGAPHAEVAAFNGLSGELPAGSTLVVTLEPCNHHGRTPPCTEAILTSGIGRVVVGAVDPDPRVAGQGIERLRAGGITVEAGLLSSEVEKSDPGYFHHRRTGRSFIILKTAITLDGQTAALDGSSQWITAEEARHDAQLLRASSDAVMVGAATIRADDPLLTVRLTGYPGPQPVAVVVGGGNALPAQARLWERVDTIVVATRPVDVPAETLLVSAGDDGFPDLGETAIALGERGLLTVMVEGGAGLAASLWGADLVDMGVTYLGGRLAGGRGMPMFSGRWATLADSRPVMISEARRIGPDVRVDWHPMRE